MKRDKRCRQYLAVYLQYAIDVFLPHGLRRQAYAACPLMIVLGLGFPFAAALPSVWHATERPCPSVLVMSTSAEHRCLIQTADPCL